MWFNRKKNNNIVDGVEKISSGFYRITPQNLSDGRLYIELSTHTHNMYSEQPIFVLSRNHWHCQFQERIKEDPFAYRNHVLRPAKKTILLTTGLERSQDPFVLRIFLGNNIHNLTAWQLSDGQNTAWKRLWSDQFSVTLLHQDMFYPDTSNRGILEYSDGGESIYESKIVIDLKGSDKWYQATSFDEKLPCEHPHMNYEEGEEAKTRRTHEILAAYAIDAHGNVTKRSDYYY